MLANMFNLHKQVKEVLCLYQYVACSIPKEILLLLCSRRLSFDALLRGYVLNLKIF